MVSIIENTTAVQNPSIANPGTILETNKTINASITNVNKPKVKIVTGRDNIISIGLTKVLRAAITTAVINATTKLDTSTPERRYAVAYTANPFIKNFIILFILTIL